MKPTLTVLMAVTGFATAIGESALQAAPLPGGTLDPTTIPKYVTPLVIPPVMKPSSAATPNTYDIAVRQFQQQILPSPFPATTVWSYGPAQDPTSQFNYPAYTIETTVNTTVNVNWINDLVVDPDKCKKSTDWANDANCNYLPHITPVDRSLHWANPELLPCGDGTTHTDCRPASSNGLILQQPYLGPVPIVPHLHGAHVGPESDGYPHAWWLPNANNIPATYATTGSLVNQYATPTNTAPGVANFTYPNTQPSTTLWFHDHTIGMTRNNVYAGPAGFWLIRDKKGGETGLVSGTLPGPAPVAGQSVLDLNKPGNNAVRAAIREIPIVIQDRSFNADGSLFYPGDRAFFQEVRYNQLNMPFIGDPQFKSDISAIWNPEAFFNVMVVNGVSWPKLEVEPDRYRFRLLNGCNSRFLNLSLFVVDANGQLTTTELPFYQIGADQGLLPHVVEVKLGSKTKLPGNGTIPVATAAASRDEGLLMGLAERADVIVDFSALPEGTRVRMINTGPDSPFGGFPVAPVADPATTGQVMEFVVTAESTVPNDPTETFTAPADLVLSLPDANDPANKSTVLRDLRDMALMEEESTQVCVFVAPNGVINYDKNSVPDINNPGTCLNKSGMLARSVPMAPKAAVLGISGATGGTATMFTDPLVTNPKHNSSETWELWNWSADAHPIHLHLVKFKVVNRQTFDPLTGNLAIARPPEFTEAGWKDTVIAYPGEVTRVNATFDIPGLYVWHCHILEHEDNEMMVPYCVGDKTKAPGCQAVP